jgi:DNA-directed RNA polymerase subunit alpha
MIKPNFFTQIIEEGSTYGKFIIEPLPLSFGQSLGHALRRTLLSSLSGYAITSIKIEGISNMFMTIKGIKESVLEFVLHLKQLRFQQTGDGPYKIELESKKEGKLYGKDIKGDVEVINKDLYITEITASKTKLYIEAIVEKGIGYVPVEDRENKPVDYISVDAFFSPVKKVNFKVEDARVGRKTNFDRLILEVWTDGSLKPKEALQNSAHLLSEYFAYILSGQDIPKQKVESTDVLNEAKLLDQKLFEIIIDELNLPSRVINALLRENIETVADLVKIGKDKLKVMKGVGKKSIELIEEELKKMGIQLEQS